MHAMLNMLVLASSRALGQPMLLDLLNSTADVNTARDRNTCAAAQMTKHQHLGTMIYLKPDQVPLAAEATDPQVLLPVFTAQTNEVLMRLYYSEVHVGYIALTDRETPRDIGSEQQISEDIAAQSCLVDRVCTDPGNFSECVFVDYESILPGEGVFAANCS